MAVCMICFEGGPPNLYRGICNCTGAVVHDTCLEAMLRVPSHRMKCAVCHAPYTSFVTERIRSQIECAALTNVAIVLFLHITYPLALTGMWHTIDILLHSRHSILPLALALGSFTSLAFVSLFCLICRYGFFGCVRRRKAFQYKVDYSKLQRVNDLDALDTVDVI